MQNTRSEVDVMRTPADASRDKRTVATPSISRDQKPIATPSIFNNKFSQETTEDEDEFGHFPFSPEDVASVVKVAEQASVATPMPQTPSKSTTAGILPTPATKRKWDETGLLTPATGGTKGKSLFGTPATRLNGGMWDGNEPFGSKNVTPTPNRFKEPSDIEPADQSAYDLTDEILEILKDKNLDVTTTADLKKLFGRHALKIAGIVRGRDISRVALKTKDAKIAELQQRITSLETEREMDKTVIKHFKNDMSHSVANRRGRGRGRGKS
jgi:hypothetical protein